MTENNKDNILYWLNMASNVIGSVAGGAIGAYTPTLAGSIVGNTIAPLVSGTLQNIGQDMRARHLSKKEELRIGSAFYYLIQKFNDNVANEKKVRADDFFQGAEGEYNRNEEILEGLLLIAQKSYEEKKIRFISNFYANILFEQTLDTYHANHYLRTAEQMSYRQFCLLAIFYNKHHFYISDSSPTGRHDFKEIRYDTMADIRALDEKGLVTILNQINYGPQGYKFHAPAEHTMITNDGRQFYALFDLSALPIKDLIEVAEHLVDAKDLERVKAKLTIEN